MDLSPQQLAVVESTTAHKKVIAGAGSGKTRLLVAQVVYWLAQGVDPAEITAVTFTRRAGEELRRRIYEEVGVELGWVGTIHAFCLDTMWDAGHFLIPLDAVELGLVVEHVATDMKLLSAKLKNVVKWISGDSKTKSISGADRVLAGAVRTFMASNQLVWVGDMLTTWLRAFVTDVGLQAISKARTRCTVWDEHQDSCESEMRILEGLAPDRVVVVADPRQAIYQFRGASPKWTAMFAGEVHELSINYRSCPEIVEESNRVAPHGYAPMIAHRGDKGTVSTWTGAPHERGNLLQELVADSDSPVYVLARSNRELAQWGRDLDRAGLDVLVVSTKMDPYDTKDWRNAYACARWVMDRNNPWITTSVAALAATGVVDLDWIQFDVEEDSSMHRMCLALPALADVSDKVKQMTVREYTFWYGDRDIADQLTDDDDGPEVVCISAHKSKGLEFETVVLADVGGRLGGREGEGEKELLFVAVSRAMDRLVLEVKSS